MYLSISIEKSGAGLPDNVGVFKASGLETFSYGVGVLTGFTI